VLEYTVQDSRRKLPAGVKTELGPDATSLGWVFQYALVDRTGKHVSDEAAQLSGLVHALRCAGRAWRGRGRHCGGQVRQYQVTVSPDALAAYKLPLQAVIEAVRKGNNDVGGRLVELSGREYMVRGRGYVKFARRSGEAGAQDRQRHSHHGQGCR